MEAGRFEEALALAEDAVAGARTCVPAHGFLASVLLKLGRTPDAEHVIARASDLGTGVADAYDGLAFVAMALGLHARSNELYRRATQVAPADPRFWYNLACSERSLGRLVEAEVACDHAIGLDGSQYASHLLRSELGVQSPESNHIRELEAALARAGDDYRARVFLGYALAKELDDLGRFDEAFHWFSRAANARRARLEYDVAMDERKLLRIAEVYSHHRRVGSRTADPRSVDSSRYIFIIGLPRSGTTLVERILSALPGVRANGETDHFSRALLAAARGAGDVFARAAAADPEAVATGYARLAEPGVPAEFIIEKMPLNYLYVGAIRQALPNAKIVLVSRQPLDSCFAMYRTLFAAGYPFSYDLADLGRYYAAYRQLMNHWHAGDAEPLHQVVYEDLVREPRPNGMLIAQHCGLKWSDSAIEIQNNTSVSLTASAAQVRRPIYGSSSGRWQHYRHHLGVLIDTLRRLGVALPA